MANRTVITSKGLQLLSNASASGENSYWIGYYGLAYVPEENRGVGGDDYLSSSTAVLTKTGDHIYNVWQGSMTPVGFDTDTSAASDLYNKCLYTSNVMARYRYVLDENGKNNLVMWRGTTDSSSYKLTGAAVYRGIGATNTDGTTVTTSQMPIPAPLFYLGEPTDFSTPMSESELVDAVKYPNSAEDFPVFDSLPAVSTDTRDYTASSKHTLMPPDESGSFSDHGSLSGKYEWTAAEKTYTQDGDAQDDAPIAEDENKYCKQYWKYQTISNFNRFHAPASSEGYSVDYEPSCRNMSKATKYFPISYYKVLNVEGGESETGSTTSSTATSLQFTVNISLKDLNNTVANRTNTAEIEVAEGHESGINDADGNDLFTTRTASVKFNRVGIYAVPMTVHRFTTDTEDGSCGGTKIQFEIMGDAEPVLFAVSDIDEVTVKEGGGIDSWKIDFVLNLTDATSDGAILRDTSIFYNMYEDDAITWYKNQLIATASLSESIMNQAIEINYLKNMIGNLSTSSSNCSTVSASGQWASKNHTHPYMRNIVDSTSEGNGAVRGIYTKEEGTSIIAYDTVGVKAYKCNNNVLALNDNGFYRFGKYEPTSTESVLTDSDAVTILESVGVSKFAADIADGLCGYYVSTDGSADIGTDTSAATQYDPSHIYVQVSVTSDSGNLGVLVVSRTDGTYRLVKNSDVSSMENADLNPQYISISDHQIDDVRLEIDNYTVGDKAFVLGENSASAGKYNLNISKNGLISDDSDYNILAGGNDTTQDESVDNLIVKDTSHSIVMGGNYSNEVSGSENILAMIGGKSNVIGGTDGSSNSIAMIMSDGNELNDMSNSIAVLGTSSHAENIKSSLMIDPKTCDDVFYSIVVNANADDGKTILGSVVIGEKTNADITRSVIVGNGTVGAISNETIASVMNPSLVENVVTNSFVTDSDENDVKYGNISSSILLSCGGVGILNPMEYIPLYEDTPSFSYDAEIGRSIVNGGIVNSDVYGVIGAGDKTYFPSRSSGIIEIGDCSPDMEQRSNVEFVTIDELNELYGSQAPSEAFNSGNNIVVMGTGTLSLMNGDGTTYEKSVKGVSLYVYYSTDHKQWCDGYDWNSTEYDFYGRTMTAPSNWSNLLLIGTGANAGVNSENSIFVGKNSSWSKTTFKNSFINTLGSDGGAKYAKYSYNASGTLLSEPNTVFDNVWWIGHASSSGTGCDNTNGAFSLPMTLGYNQETNEFKDAFVFIGSNDELFNHAYWYGVIPELQDVDGNDETQPYKTPMIFTGGIALGGAGSSDCNFGMMKLGCSRDVVTAQHDIYKSYSQSIVTYDPDPKTDDSIILRQYEYGNVQHQLMQSPHSGKNLIVQDLQELDGTLHIGLGYPTNSIYNSTSQYAVICSYAGSAVNCEITIAEPGRDFARVLTYKHSNPEFDIPEGETSDTVVRTTYDPDIGMSFTTKETLAVDTSSTETTYKYSCIVSLNIKPRNKCRYFFPWSYVDSAEIVGREVQILGADTEGLDCEVFNYSSVENKDSSITFNGLSFTTGGGMKYQGSTPIYYPGGSQSKASVTSPYAYYYHLTSVKTLVGGVGGSYKHTYCQYTCELNGDLKGTGTYASETWHAYPFAIQQLYGEDVSNPLTTNDLIILK